MERGRRMEIYHDNGQLSQEGKYVNGKQEGEWKSFHDNGQLKWQGKYVNRKQEGEWKEFYTIMANC